MKNGNLIGTLLVAGRFKQSMVQYKLFFTENRLIAIETGPTPSKVGGYPVLSARAGLAKGLAQGAEDAKIMNLWEDIVIDTNKSHKSLVSYQEKLSNDMLNLPSISMPYDKVSAVTLKKASRDGIDPNKTQYIMAFTMGLFSSESFFIPGTTLDDVMALLKKTPLGSKLK